MDVGKLYKFNDEFIANVNYQFIDKSEASWWGELVPEAYSKLLSDSEGYIIELEDGRRGRCSLKRRVNRAVRGVPPIYYYYFRGGGPLK